MQFCLLKVLIKYQVNSDITNSFYPPVWHSGNGVGFVSKNQATFVLRLVTTFGRCSIQATQPGHPSVDSPQWILPMVSATAVEDTASSAQR